MSEKTKPIKNPEEVQQHPDGKIDQDFPGFPHAPASPKLINPKTKDENKVSGTDKEKSDKTYGGTK